MENREQPLKIEITDDGRFVISIGIETLAFCANMSDLFNPLNEERGDWFPIWKVTDELEWAKDLRCAMYEEREDGSTPLTDFFDKMEENALDDGSLAVEEVPLPPWVEEEE